MNEILAAKIVSAFSETDAHVLRLLRASEKLNTRFPLTEDGFKRLGDDAIETLDQFLYRFLKLQDSLATRLFPALRSVLSGDQEPQPFLDTLNQLEKAGIVPSVQAWMELRELRNDLAHEYPESVGQTVATLNRLYERWDELKTILDNAHRYHSERIEPLLGGKGGG